LIQARGPVSGVQVSELTAFIKQSTNQYVVTR
jgi:hypothetical protein